MAVETGDEYSDRINSLPKYVASKTLEEATWNATILEGDVAEEVAKLKQLPGENLLKFGTGELDRTLMGHNLVDEFHFWLFPVAAILCYFMPEVARAHCRGLDGGTR